MKTLYIFPSDNKIFIMLDGTSLKIIEEGKSLSRFPFKRLSKIICKGSVNFDTTALLTCLDNNIGVYFLNSKGDLRASCFGSYTVEKSFERVISEFLEMDNWQEKLLLWENNNYRKNLMLIDKVVLSNLKSYRKEDVDSYFLNYLKIPKSSDDIFLSLMKCYVSECFKKLGVPNIYISNRNSLLSLEDVFSNTLKPILYGSYPELSKYIKNNIDKYIKEETKIIIKRYEIIEQLILKNFLRSYKSFERYLRECINEP